MSDPSDARPALSQGVTPDKGQVSWQVSLNIWIRRFGEARKAIAELEAENQRLRDRLELAYSLMTDEQITVLTEKLITER